MGDVADKLHHIIVCSPSFLQDMTDDFHRMDTLSPDVAHPVIAAIEIPRRYTDDRHEAILEKNSLGCASPLRIPDFFGMNSVLLSQVSPSVYLDEDL